MRVLKTNYMIVSIIQRDKHTSYAKIADEIGLEERQVQRYVHELREYYPEIIIKRGRYDGGVFWEERKETK